MTDIRATVVDPRQYGSEVWEPRYRVDFWRPLGERAYASRTLQLTHAPDATAVLAWAESHRAHDETHVVMFAVLPDNTNTVVRLVGEDPTRT